MATTVQSNSVSLDMDYIKSKQGLLRIAEAVIGLCGIISVSQGAYCSYYGHYSFYNFVVVTTLILAVIILVVYMLQLQNLCTFVNCFLTVFVNDIVFAILYLVATILMIVAIGACSYGQVARIFATLFGICGTIVLGLLSLMEYQTIKSNQGANPA